MLGQKEFTLIASVCHFVLISYFIGVIYTNRSAGESVGYNLPNTLLWMEYILMERGNAAKKLVCGFFPNTIMYINPACYFLFSLWLKASS